MAFALRQFKEFDLLLLVQKVNAETTNLRRLKRLASIQTLSLLKLGFSDKNYTKKREFEYPNSGKVLMIRGSAPVTSRHR